MKTLWKDFQEVLPQNNDNKNSIKGKRSEKHINAN